MKLRTVDTGRTTRTTLTLVVASASALMLWEPRAAASLAAGGAFMLADFHLIRILVSRLMARRGSRGLTFALLTLKFLLIFVLAAGVLYRFPVAPMWFACGASLLLAAIVAEAAWLGDPVAPPGQDTAT